MSFKYDYSPKTLMVLDVSNKTLASGEVLNYKLDFTYNMTQKSALNLSSFKYSVDSVNVSSLKAETIGVAFKYSYDYSNKINVSIVADSSKVKSDGYLSESVGFYEDKLLNLSLVSSYILNKNVMLTFGYSFQSRDSSRRGFDFEYNIFQVSSNLKF